MARTGPTQEVIESTIKSPRSCLRNRGSAATDLEMHSVAERISGCTAAFFCCTVRLAGEPLGSPPGTTAALTASAAPANLAMIMLFPLPGRNGSPKDHAGTEHFS